MPQRQKIAANNFKIIIEHLWDYYDREQKEYLSYDHMLSFLDQVLITQYNLGMLGRYQKEQVLLMINQNKQKKYHKKETLNNILQIFIDNNQTKK